MFTVIVNTIQVCLCCVYYIHLRSCNAMNYVRVAMRCALHAVHTHVARSINTWLVCLIIYTRIDRVCCDHQAHNISATTTKRVYRKLGLNGFVPLGRGLCAWILYTGPRAHMFLCVCDQICSIVASRLAISLCSIKIEWNERARV